MRLSVAVASLWVPLAGLLRPRRRERSFPVVANSYCRATADGSRSSSSSDSQSFGLHNNKDNSTTTSGLRDDCISNNNRPRQRQQPLNVIYATRCPEWSYFRPMQTCAADRHEEESWVRRRKFAADLLLTACLVWLIIELWTCLVRIRIRIRICRAVGRLARSRAGN